MSRSLSRAALVFLVGLLLVLSIGVSCTPVPDFGTRLESIAGPFRFSALKWQIGTLLGQARQAVFDRDAVTGGDVDRVTDYFSAVRRIRSPEPASGAVNAGGRPGDPASLQAEANLQERQALSSRAAVQRILAQQVKDALRQQGIFNPLDRWLGLQITFPPVNFELAEPPNLLVVSPRDRIERIAETTLQQRVTPEQAGGIEDEVDRLGVSSLVTGLGGFAGTYPAFVNDQSGIRSTIETVAHEWVHQYLAFKPLGFAYLLDLTGISRDHEVATINETVASMFGKEIASMVYERYYAGHEGGTARASGGESVFNREMREIRRAVDQYLARGEVEEAEKFMEQKRQDLAAKGYYIRKLNQAYFAFNGTYADGPMSVSPIGSELRKLRSQQKSLKEFLDSVSAITTRQELVDYIQ